MLAAKRHQPEKNDLAWATPPAVELAPGISYWTPRDAEIFAKIAEVSKDDKVAIRDESLKWAYQEMSGAQWTKATKQRWGTHLAGLGVSRCRHVWFGLKMLVKPKVRSPWWYLTNFDVTDPRQLEPK